MFSYKQVGQIVLNLYYLISTISIASDDISILSFGIVEAISKFYSTSWNFDNIILWNLYDLFAVVIGHSDCNIIENIIDFRVIIAGFFDSDLTIDVGECNINLGCSS